jgi:hypothetical protein
MALVNRALEAGWVQVANSYIETNPFQGQRLEELWTLQDPDPMSPAALQAQITAEARLREPAQRKSLHRRLLLLHPLSCGLSWGGFLARVSEGQVVPAPRKFYRELR